MSVPIFDLHCDLLAYMAARQEKDAAYHRQARTSIPDLKEGGVTFQTFALWTETYQEVLDQMDAYERLLQQLPKEIKSALAMENASGLLNEGEPLALLKPRLDGFSSPLLYVSLTWKEENRFGGGDLSKEGLKKDGEALLELLEEKRIAVDLSHASDALADDIFNWIHKKRSSLIPIASHSNFRAVCSCPRNLPDMFAKEIVNLGGIVGMNFVKKFIGENKEDLLRMIEHGIDCIGEDHLAFGCDFFGGLDNPHLQKGPVFFPSFDRSSAYPEMITFFKTTFSLEQIHKMAYQNAHRFFTPTLEEVKDETLTP